jgi:hypothetical protein
MRIPAITKLLVNCWSDAERNVLRSIRRQYHGADEDFITTLLHGKLRLVLEEAKESGAVADAFRSDVQSAFGPVSNAVHLREIASRLAATCTLHQPSMECRTGGDIGLVLIRPEGVSVEHSQNEYIEFKEYKRGLLVQAKKGVPNNRGRVNWGTFTDNQKQVLPQRIEYLAILLYEYQDVERLTLKDFQWLLCGLPPNRLTFDKVQECLKGDRLPSVCSSNEVLNGLGKEEIGTADKDIIEEYIEAESRPWLVIRIGWDPDYEPGIREPLLRREKQKARILA